MKNSVIGCRYLRALTSQLERKREKKRIWKKITKNQDIEASRLQEDLDERSELLEKLQGRIDILEKAMHVGNILLGVINYMQYIIRRCECIQEVCCL